MKYLIALNGCDDTTYCELELKNYEKEILIKISKEINKCSSYGCQPTISIYKDYIKKENYYELSSGYSVEKDEYEWEATDLVGQDNENIK